MGLLNRLTSCRFAPTVHFCKHLVRFCHKKGDDYVVPGTYILFPDIPKDTKETNELLRIPTIDQPTRFDKVTPENCVKAIGKLSVQLESFLEQVDDLIKKNPSLNLEELIFLMENNLVPLDFALTTARTLRHVTNDMFRSKHFDKFCDRVSRLRSKRFQTPAIYFFMREIDSDKDKLCEQQKRVVDKYLLEARLFGMNLSDNEKDKLNILNGKIQEAKNNFRENVDGATKRFRHTIDDPNLLRDFPDDFISLVGNRNLATVTLQPSVFTSFMEYCPDSELRWNVWQAYNSRASPYVDSRISNALVIEEIRSQRKRMAQTLGFANFAEYSMQTKMAGSIENVKLMINTLHLKSKVAFEKCLAGLNEFARKSGNENEELALWDIPYWKRKLLKSTYTFDEVLIRQNFPLNVVLDGLFRLTEKLFSIRIEEVSNKNISFWHKDVRFFRILDNKKVISSFVFDPFARPSKFPGTWIETPLTNCNSLKIKPLTYLMMNLSRPLTNQPVLLSFNEILTLFKRFGNILQNSMNEMKYFEISGLNNLEWDAVNIVPEFLALWPLNSYKIISSCSLNVKNQSPVSEELFEMIRKAYYHFSSFNLKNELYRSALDLSLYSNDEYWNVIVDQVWKEFMTPFNKLKEDVHPCSFREIFCDDFASSYFSFKWSQMLAADVFSAFQEAVLDNDESLSKIGFRFKETFLANGGGCPSSEVFRRFRGRDPSPDAFLDINGLFKKNTGKSLERNLNKRIEKKRAATKI